MKVNRTSIGLLPLIKDNKHGDGEEKQTNDANPQDAVHELDEGQGGEETTEFQERKEQTVSILALA